MQIIDLGRWPVCWRSVYALHCAPQHRRCSKLNNVHCAVRYLFTGIHSTVHRRNARKIRVSVYKCIVVYSFLSLEPNVYVNIFNIGACRKVYGCNYTLLYTTIHLQPRIFPTASATAPLRRPFTSIYYPCISNSIIILYTQSHSTLYMHSNYFPCILSISCYYIHL